MEQVQAAPADVYVRYLFGLCGGGGTQGEASSKGVGTATGVAVGATSGVAGPEGCLDAQEPISATN